MFPNVLRTAVTILQVLLFVYILLSFFPGVNGHPLARAVERAAEVLLLPARQLFEALGIRRGPLDWTPLFTIFLLNILEALIMKLVYG